MLSHPLSLSRGLQPHISTLVTTNLRELVSAPAVSDLTPEPHPAPIASFPLQVPVPAKPLNPLLGLLNESWLALAGPMAPRPLLLLCPCTGVLSSVLEGRCELSVVLLLREERERRSCPAGSLAPKTCSLRSIAMVGVVYHEEKGRAWAGSLALRFLLHFTENALHGSGLHGTIVLLSSCHSTRENSYLLVDACDPRRSTYHGKVNTARSKQACQDVETHFFFLEHKIRRQTQQRCC